MAEDKELELVTCPTCDGDGILATSHKFRCYSCKGSGKVDKSSEAALIEAENKMLRNLSDSVTAWEYRTMGG